MIPNPGVHHLQLHGSPKQMEADIARGMYSKAS